MDEAVLEKYRQAGRILSQVLEEARSIVDVGVSLLEVAEAVEASIYRLGGKPAFPCNISLDRIAAHYTPSPGDESCFSEQMIKVDVGVHMDGYIADSAITIDLSGHDQLVEASKAALDAAIELVAPGANTAEFGRAIEEVITGYGYRPVANLTGHGLERYLAHANPSIHNVAVDKGVELEVGDVIAIEPFATDGAGRITEGPTTEIFGFSVRRPIRAAIPRKLMKDIQDKYSTLPFARRWLNVERVDYALNQLLRSGVIHGYPILWEAEGALVSQAEHTLVVMEGGVEVITR